MQYDLSTLPTSELSTEVKGLNYSIIKYKKECLNEENLETLGLFRSVIVEYADADADETPKQQFRTVSFSPPKSIPYETFINQHPLDECVVEEFVDGTMINIFWSEVANEWIINTKSNIGANSHFFVFPTTQCDKSYHTKSFYDMFFEALGDFDLASLDKSCSYSFVLQHPMNRIVCPVTVPTLYIVGIYKLNGNVVSPIDVQSYSGFNGNQFKKIYKPMRYDAKSYSELGGRFARQNPMNPTPYNVMGIIVRHPQSGHRTKLRNPNYEYVKALRGNNPRLDYRYLELRSSNRVKEYLNYFPEHSYAFKEYRRKIHVFTKHLYNNYVNCYILKKNKLSYFSIQYKTNMYNLHQLYLTSYKPEGKYITYGIVISFVNSLPIPLLLHSMNYDYVQSIAILTDPYCEPEII